MDFLLLSILALAAGPLLVLFLGRRQGVTQALDAFVLVAIAGLVFLEILPEGIRHGGWPALVAAALGLLIPTFGEQVLKSHVRKTHSTLLMLGILALGLHVFLDGMVLGENQPFLLAHEGTQVQAGAPSSTHGGAPAGEAGAIRGTQALKIGIVLHRIPVGIGIWWIISSAFGARIAILVLLTVVAATAGGFFSSGLLLTHTETSLPAIIQSLLAGSLLHVVLHTHGRRSGEKPDQGHLLSALGGFLGLGVLALLPLHGLTLPPGRSGPLSVFLDMALASAPALLLAYFFVGLAHVFLSERWFRFLGRGSALSQSWRGMLVGLPVPVCSCGVVPLYRELVKKGVPMAAAMSFLIATPELELAAVLLSFQLLGSEVALARLLAAGGLALLVGLLTSRFCRSSNLAPPEASPGKSAPLSLDLVHRGFRFGFGDAVDDTAPWILLGLGVAAFMSPFLDPALFAAVPSLWQVPVMALVGMPLYVCASGSTPLAAILLLAGLSPGAALAFLLTGPATNVTTMGVIARLHDRRTALIFAGIILFLTTLLGYAVNLFLPHPLVPPLASLRSLGQGLWHQGAAWLLALLFGASLLRQGTRGFVSRVTSTPLLFSPADSSPGSSAGGCCS